MKLDPWETGPLPEAHAERPRPWFLALASFLAPAYLRLALKVRSVRMEGAETLKGLYREAGEGKARFLVAFRHPGDADPHIVFWALNCRLAKKILGRGRGAFGGRFVSGAEIPLWGGPVVRWALRNAGTVPVAHGRLDRRALDYLVRAIMEDPTPVVLAPEGQVSYHSGTVQSLDAGVARLALWASERLADAGNPIPVRLVPLSVDYRFLPDAYDRLPGFLSRLERRCGIQEALDGEIRERLARLWERLVSVAEEQYARVYNLALAPEGSCVRERIRRLIEGALARVEAFYGLSPSGDLRARVMAARAEAMERVFHPDERWKRMSPLERGMARRTAGEAFFLDRHQQLTDLAEYLDPDYAAPDAPPDRLIETAQNLWDLANRLEGGDIGFRSRTFRKDVVLTAGPPVTAERHAGEKKHAAAERILSELFREFAALTRTAP